MTELVPGAYHRFEADGRPFLYLVESAAVFGIDDTADAILQALQERGRSRDALVEDLSAGHSVEELGDTICLLYTSPSPRD